MTTVTEAAAISSIVGLAASQLGTHENNGRVKYCDWWYSTGLSPHVRSLLWCDVFVSWTFNQRGMGAAVGGRYAFTVAHRQWFQKNATRVSFAHARAGDVIFYRFPTSGSRNGNPVNHVEIVTRGYSGGTVGTIGGNTPKPGTVGDPSNGRGVWAHTRGTYAVVDVWRPVWSKVSGAPVLKKGMRGRAVRVLQGKAGCAVDGVFGKKTKAAVKRLQGRLGVKRDGVWGSKSQAAYDRFVDGKFGPATVKLWQKNAGTPVDGKISKPSTLIRTVQREDSKSGAVRGKYKLTGHEIDGVFGSKTVLMLQDLMGFTGKQLDGVFGPVTIKALQRRLLRGRH